MKPPSFRSTHQTPSCKFVFTIALLLYVGLSALVLAEDKSKLKIEGYKSIEVTALRNKVGEVLDQKTIDELQERIVATINESKLLNASLNTNLKFPKKNADDDTQLAFEGTGKDEDKTTLVLFGELITFNKGSRAKRCLVGGGTGRQELRGNCYLIDKSTGKQVHYFQSFGETNWGVMGGGDDKTYKGFANRIVAFLKGKY